MRGELPVCKRCCFCLPLRYGLITWGYIRLITAFLLLSGAAVFFYGMLAMALSYGESSYVYEIFTIISGFVLVLALADIALNIVFIIGGHKKSLKLLRAYYIYSFILWFLTTLIGVASSIYTFFLFRHGDVDLVFHIWIVLMDVACLLAQILNQGYVILLIRSEIIKLRSNCQFRFYNNAADSECTMRCEEEIANGEERAENIERARYVPRDTCQFIGYVQKNDDC